MTTQNGDTQVALRPEAGPLSPEQVRARVNLVGNVMRAVMQKDEHYGTIPGCKKPSLYKPGAEKLMVTFRLAARVVEHDDLSTPAEVKHRFKVQIYEIIGDLVWGEGVGECSSGEEKYKWREQVCDEEWDETPEDRRRVKYRRFRDSVKKTKQIRTQLADGANTILKMAHKRALVHGVIAATGASDIFTQDVEDMPPENLQSGREAPPEPTGSASPAAGPPGKVINKAQRGRVFGILYGKETDKQVKEARVEKLKQYLLDSGIVSTNEIPTGDVYDEVCAEAQRIFDESAP